MRKRILNENILNKKPGPRPSLGAADEDIFLCLDFPLNVGAILLDKIGEIRGIRLILFEYRANSIQICTAECAILSQSSLSVREKPIMSY